ncbi:MAG: (2Fe-2S) ferredoxin domain-containing protein [Candidatus Moraniibacteriota bacterium]|nr:MAG: (2Fe-2S) ferredoxin domain-containing protein [Candidatus Moranbacteria bacterium]
MELSASHKKPFVKVCVHRDCCEKGSDRLYAKLSHEVSSDEADIQKTEDCFRFCKKGPNIAVDGNVLHHMNERNVVSRVRSEIRRPSFKKDGIGTRPIDELDDVLDNIGV